MPWHPPLSVVRLLRRSSLLVWLITPHNRGLRIIRHRPEHLQDEHAAGSRCVDRIGERTEMRAFGAQGFDH